MPDTRVGLIGLGSMGRGMGRNIVKKFQLTVFDANPAAVEDLVEFGALSAASPREVAAQSDVVVTVLPNGPDVEAVALGPDGLAEGAQPGMIQVDCSTIDPSLTRSLGASLAQRGIRLVDAAMGRSSAEAASGDILFMVGAEPEDFRAVRPVLETMGKDIFHVGPPGHGITLKLVHNLLSLTMLASCVEAMVLGAKAGLDVRRMLEVLEASTTGNGHLRGIIPRQVLSGDYTPGFRVALAQKDLALGRDLAAALNVPLQTLLLSRELYTAAASRGHADRATGSIATVLEEIVGIRLADLAKEQAAG